MRAGLPHHRERRLDERLPHVVVEAGADLADERDLALARRTVGRTTRYAAQYSATVKVPSARGSRASSAWSSSCESALSSVACAIVAITRAGEDPRHDGHDAREIRIALREVGAAVEIGQEERDRVGVARLRGEIRVRASPSGSPATTRERAASARRARSRAVARSRAARAERASRGASSRIESSFGALRAMSIGAVGRHGRGRPLVCLL